jgi:hypothetical protein
MVINRSIEMIAHNKPDGSIRPLRFRMMEEDELQVIKVNKVFTSRVEKIDGKLTYVFNCMVSPRGLNHMCEIRYDLATTKWILHKM